VFVTHRRRGDRAAGRGRDAGQTLVEFAFVFPLFIMLIFAIIEFTFVFSGMLGISYATREAALFAAEAGSQNGADCVIIVAVDNAIAAPASDDQIGSITIYRANTNGTEMSGESNVWTRGGSHTCPNGTVIPYTRQTNSYPEVSRCNILAGCGTDAQGWTHSGVDTIGVRVSYTHHWVTPLGGFPGPGFVGQGGSGFQLTQSNAMRMEPVL
jgi:Flp pilus assembly protein TadG